MTRNDFQEAMDEITQNAKRIARNTKEVNSKREIVVTDWATVNDPSHEYHGLGFRVKEVHGGEGRIPMAYGHLLNSQMIPMGDEFAFPMECLEFYTRDPLTGTMKKVQSQKPVDPGHDKTISNAAGGRQSKLEYAVGSADPLATLAMAKVQAEGDAKYGKDNWRLIDEDDHLAHALTHIMLHRVGDGDEAHLAHALTRVHMAMAKHLRPDYYGEWKPADD